MRALARVWLAVAVAVIAIVVGERARVAEACVCLDPGLHSPTEGADGVPLNVEILRAGRRADYPAVLLVDEVEVAPLDSEVVRDELRLVRLTLTVGSMAPDTTYTVRLGPRFPQDPDDFTDVSFHTGDGDDHDAPLRPTIEAWRLAHAPYTHESSCGIEASLVDLRVADDPDAVSYEAVFTGPDLEQSYLLLADELRRLGTSSCSIPLAARLAEDYCVTLRARDLAGNASAPATACTTARVCPAIDPLSFDGDLFECAQPADGAGGCTTGDGSGGPIVVVLIALLAYPRRAARPRSRRAR